MAAEWGAGSEAFHSGREGNRVKWGQDDVVPLQFMLAERKYFLFTHCPISLF